MWQRIAIRTTSLLSFIGFLILSLSLLVVTTTLAINLFTDIKNGRIISIVLIAVISTTIFLFSLSFFQIIHYFGSNTQRKNYQDNKDKWLETWNDVLWNNKEIPQTKDILAAEALVAIADNISLDYQDRFKEIYHLSGLRDKELRILKRSSLPEAKAQVLEHLAIISDISNTEIIQKELNSSIPELSILAFFALAKTYAKTNLKQEEIIEIFIPIIESNRFSKGIIEEVLVLLGNNAEGPLYYLSKSGSGQKQIQAGLAAIGHFANLQWADWCIPWLDADNPEITATALKALADMSYVPVHAYNKVYEALNDPNWFVRNQAVKASIGILGNKIDDYLVEAISDEAWWVRYNAASVLAQKGHHGQDLLTEIVNNHTDSYARDIASHFLN